MSGGIPGSADSARSESERRALVALSLIPGVGTRRIRSLIGQFGTADAVLHASARELATVPGIGRQTAGRIAAFDAFRDVEAQLRRAEQVDARMITIWDDRFPFLLRQIYDPPVFLWVRGDLRGGEDERVVAIVGTRRPSSYGRRVAHDLAYLLARLGCTIVSGLAYGIDAAAHAAALEAGGKTIAVMGSGVDRIYPGTHRRLAHQMLATGAIISEFPLGAKPDAPNFPRRNRLVSGLAHGTIVVEAYEEGGALITARLAVEQNREVFAVPGPIFSATSAGSNLLIQRGEAQLVQRVEDILDGLGVTPVRDPHPSRSVDLSSLDPTERALYRALESEPVHLERLCAATGLDASTALVGLLNLEFKGIARQLAGRQFLLTTSAMC